MKLYSAALSPFTAKVRIALYEKEIPFEKITLAWSPATGVTGKPPEMLAINPKGQVPTMIDGDVKLYDSTVILEYLEERYPKPALYPTAIGDRVLCRLIEDAGDTIIADSVGRLAGELFAKTDPAMRDQAAIEKATAELRQAYVCWDRLRFGELSTDDLSDGAAGDRDRRRYRATTDGGNQSSEGPTAATTPRPGCARL